MTGTVALGPATVRRDTTVGDLRDALGGGAAGTSAPPSSEIGAHNRDAPSGVLLYAGLLHVGGQIRLAQRQLDDVEARSPGNTLVAEARAQRLSDASVAVGGRLSGA